MAVTKEIAQREAEARLLQHDRKVLAQDGCDHICTLIDHGASPDLVKDMVALVRRQIEHWKPA